jgi:hypothetical protein
LDCIIDDKGGRGKKFTVKSPLSKVSGLSLDEKGQPTGTVFCGNPFFFRKD